MVGRDRHKRVEGIQGTCKALGDTVCTERQQKVPLARLQGLSHQMWPRSEGHMTRTENNSLLIIWKTKILSLRVPNLASAMEKYIWQRIRISPKHWAAATLLLMFASLNKQQGKPGLAGGGAPGGEYGTKASQNDINVCGSPFFK